MREKVENIDISVIVPVYNVEEYLGECLQSLRDQTKKNIEIIMVNDGSTDASGRIAQDYAEKYENFRYFYKENGGLGCARNYGVKRAGGKYIAFVDSDDKLALDLYEKMFLYAERDQSELTICNVLRFNSKKIWASGLHKRVFKDIDLQTHITENPNLLYDTVSWNKLILRSFYEKNHFAFPEKILYEDIPVTIPMHYKANRVSVVESSHYYWRVRDGATKSITQCADNLTNLRDRIKILRMLDAFFAENQMDRESCLLKQKKTLEIDLMIFVNQCKSLPEETGRQMLAELNAYIQEAIEDCVFDMLPLIARQKYAYVREYKIEKLIKLLHYQDKDYYNARIEEKDGRFTVALPENLFSIKERDITKELLSYEPKRGVTSVKMNPGGCQITGYIFNRRIHSADPFRQNISVYLENEWTGCLTPLDAEPLRDESVTEMFGAVFDSATNDAYNYNYDGASFLIRLDLEKLEIHNGNRGANRVLVLYENRYDKGKLRLSGARKTMRGNAVVWGDKYMQIRYDELNEMRICLEDGKDFAAGLTAEDGKIQVTLESEKESLFAESERGNRLPFVTDDKKIFCADINDFEKNIAYSLRLGGFKETGAQLFFREKNILVYDEKSPAVIFKTNQDYGIRLLIKERVTCLEDLTRSGKTVCLRVQTAKNGPDDFAPQAYLYVDDSISGERVVLAKAEGEAVRDKIQWEFSICFQRPKVTKNLYTSWRDLRICYADGDGREWSDVIYCRKFYKTGVHLPTLTVSLYRGSDGILRLMSKSVWKKEEDSWQKRKALIAANYPKYRQEEIDPKCIVFESMWGAKYSCNPQYLYEYIDKNYPQYKCVWSLNDERMPIKGRGIRVRRHSQEYYHYLATAKYLVNNVNFPNEYVKREGQIEIQTMHGTPLKTFGLDVTEELPNEDSRKRYIEKNSRWNYLVVQGKFMEEKAYDCFGYKKEILKTGYPRTDILFSQDKERALSIKKKLGLPLDKKVILYAPTWRVRGNFHMQLDLEKMKREFADEYILLIRLHYFSPVSENMTIDNTFTFDLQPYRSIEDLYQISDLLITDYSSAMFDYALLGKPMLFFIYDLEEYRDRLRGIYVDIEKEAPGPIVFDTDEVIFAIRNLDAEVEKRRDWIRAFRERYLSYENASSCKAVVDAVIRPSRWEGWIYRLKRKIKSRIYVLHRRKNG